MTTVGYDEFDHLERALVRLRENIGELMVRAISLDDYRPVDEKIQIMRKTLQRLNARLSNLKIKKDAYAHDAIPQESIEETYQMLQEKTSKTIINNIAIKQCLHSSALSDVSIKKHKDLDKKVSSCMKNLFIFNDAVLSTQRSMEIALQKQLDLKIQCQKEIFNYHKFLKEQDELRKQKLQKTNPRVAMNKEKMLKRIRKINIAKRMITNLIATSGKLLQEEPFLVEMLEKHAELINEETIIKLTETNVIVEEHET